ncbi:MAG: hypothetical protein ISS69_07950 [Phycisphaerae bacterium]|nr:hypothetical protein [Planctomycetota bacterium]MBL7220031.1 hypothetical protein [Phycisphaerae bacterium]
MFQPEVKLEFVKRYCLPDDGWEVYVDIDASEEGRTGGKRTKQESIERQKRMQAEGAAARKALERLGVTVGGLRDKWLKRVSKKYPGVDLPEVPGDRDIVAMRPPDAQLVVAEVEGESSGQPEEKLYKAQGQIVTAVGTVKHKAFRPRFVIVVHGAEIADHLENAKRLKDIGVSGLALAKTHDEDRWVFGTQLQLSNLYEEPAVSSSPVEQLQAKRQEWAEWLSGKDRNSISRQITMMLWDAATFLFINEARRIAEEEQVSLNGTMHDFINRTFFQSQATQIRRLIDKGPTLRRGRVEHAADGERGVFSLLGLLEDMERNTNLMTRENILAAEGLEYDPTANRRAFDEYFAGVTETSGVPHHLAGWIETGNRHEVIDRLAGVKEAERSPRDTMRLCAFEALKGKLAVCADVKTYVDNYIAHSATPESRQADDAEQLKITLGHIEDAHKAISEVAGFVETVLLAGGSGSYFPSAQYNPLRDVDVPLVSKENVGKLADVRQEYTKETDKWSNWGLDELEAEMK